MYCPHLHELVRLKPPNRSQTVHRKECTQCFDDQDFPDGVDVCLLCFNGACVEHVKFHAKHHVSKTGHQWTLNIRRRQIQIPRQREPINDSKPPSNTTKLAIGDRDKYIYTATLKCWQCHAAGAMITDTRQASHLIKGIMCAPSPVRKSKLEPWREYITPCEHTLTTPPYKGPRIAPSGLATCGSCELGENLWLCLICGNLGCGRPQFGGLGGNGHGLAHYNSTKHPVSVKLGTITPEGGADLYCYECNDSTEDPDLTAHIAAFGINIQKLPKADKTMAELQNQANIKFNLDFDNMVEPLFGAGLTGIADFEQSSYMASVLQTLFALPAFQKQHLEAVESSKWHEEVCDHPLPAQCAECQLRKVAYGLLSGRYSQPAQNSSQQRRLEYNSAAPLLQTGISLAGLMASIRQQHGGSAMMHQRDAEEFFMYLMNLLRKDGKCLSDRRRDPTNAFTYTAEQRLQCKNCALERYRTDTSDILSVTVPGIPVGTTLEGQVTYSPVPLRSCINDALCAETLEWICPVCEEPVQCVKQTKITSLPQVLVVQTKKFALVDWVPTKLAIPVELPADDFLSFEEGGFEEGQELEDGTPTVANDELQFNELVIRQFCEMGIPRIRAQKALRATRNLDADHALMWLFEHENDPGIDEPSPASPLDVPLSEIMYDPAIVETLASFGFTTDQVKKALREAKHNPDQAAERLFSTPAGITENETDTAHGRRQKSSVLQRSTTRFRLLAFITHRGPSVHSGHYVAHIRHGDEWVLFNDEIVVKADAQRVSELKKMAYLYFFVRE